MSTVSLTAPRLTAHQQSIREFFDRLAPGRQRWIETNAYFYASDHAYMRFLVPEGASVLEVGCGNGQLLAALKPGRGVGLDLSPEMVRVAREAYPHLEFHVANAEAPSELACAAGPFDYIVISDTIGLLEDCQAFFLALRALCTSDTRVVVAYYGRVWEPLLRMAERVGLKMPQLAQNWLSTADTVNLLGLADYETVGREWRVLLPRRLLGLGSLVNRFLAPLPGLRRLCLRSYLVARALAPRQTSGARPSVSVVVPCRNERGNIDAVVARMPRFAPEMEIVFVEGHSRDGTYEECLRVRDAHPEWVISVYRQEGKGKGDAVRLGFERGRNDVLMILDADLTVPPETLPKFYEALARGRGELINGSRMVYPMERGAMRPLNMLGNRAFAFVLSYLMNQRFTDTLCGTKVLHRHDYARIAANRAYFGKLDPFGDFDLLFGAARFNLRILEVPIRYAERTYGATQIARFRHGLLLLGMVTLAFRKLKAFG